MQWSEIKDLVYIGAPFLAYLILLERRLTTMSTDIKWIKREVQQCLPPSDEITP